MRRRSGLILAFLLALSPACRGKTTQAKGAPDPIASQNAPAPTIEVRDDSAGLTFSYITLDGGFQLVKRVADVPYEARDAVRVWSETSGDGIAGPWVYVADLRNKRVDGTYKIEVMQRTAFEALAEDRRAKGKRAPPGPVKAPDVAAAPSADMVDPKGAKVVIYGAEWCKPCHMAEDYLKKKGIPYEHKDIEADEKAENEMKAKLQAAGIKTHSIPVLDVGGKILVGFDQGELDKALSSLN